MKREQIMDWMKTNSGFPVNTQNAIYLERFAELVAAAERDECAKVCDNIDDYGNGRNCAAAIRARGQQ